MNELIALYLVIAFSAGCFCGLVAGKICVRSVLKERELNGSLDTINIPPTKRWK